MTRLSAKLRILVLLFVLIGLSVAGNHALAAPGTEPSKEDPVTAPSKPGQTSWGGVQLNPALQYLSPYYCLAEMWVSHKTFYPCTLGNTRVTGVAGIAVDEAGYVYVAGSSMAPGATCWLCVPPGANNIDYFVVKYDPYGYEVWSHHYGGSAGGEDVASGIAVDREGNVYVTGVSWGGPETEFDYATFKIDSQGNQVWEERYNNLSANDNDAAVAIGLDDAGNVYVTGWSISTIFSNGRLMKLPPRYLTIKYLPNEPPNIRVAWQRYHVPRWPRTNQHGAAVPADIAVSGDGRVWVTGGFDNPNTPNDYGDVLADCLTVHYDRHGQEAWAKTYGGEDQWGARPAAIAVKNGNACVTGSSFTEEHARSTRRGEDYFTIKYDASGNPAWRAPLFYDGDYLLDHAVDIAIDDDENIYVSGASQLEETRGQYEHDRYDYVTIKYSPAGAEEWVSRYDGGLQLADLAEALAVTGSGDVCVTGTSKNRDFIAQNDTPWDYVTIRYRSADGSEKCVERYDRNNASDIAMAITVDEEDNVYVSGITEWWWQRTACGYDYRNNLFTTIKYKEKGTPIFIKDDDDEWHPWDL